MDFEEAFKGTFPEPALCTEPVIEPALAFEDLEPPKRKRITVPILDSDIAFEETITQDQAFGIVYDIPVDSGNAALLNTPDETTSLQTFIFIAQGHAILRYINQKFYLGTRGKHQWSWRCCRYRKTKTIALCKCTVSTAPTLEYVKILSISKPCTHEPELDDLAWDKHLAFEEIVSTALHFNKTPRKCFEEWALHNPKRQNMFPLGFDSIKRKIYRCIEQSQSRQEFGDIILNSHWKWNYFKFNKIHKAITNKHHQTHLVIDIIRPPSNENALSNALPASTETRLNILRNKQQISSLQNQNEDMQQHLTALSYNPSEYDLLFYQGGEDSFHTFFTKRLAKLLSLYFLFIAIDVITNIYTYTYLVSTYVLNNYVI